MNSRKNDCVCCDMVDAIIAAKDLNERITFWVAIAIARESRSILIAAVHREHDEAVAMGTDRLERAKSHKLKMFNLHKRENDNVDGMDFGAVEAFETCVEEGPHEFCAAVRAWMTEQGLVGAEAEKSMDALMHGIANAAKAAMRNLVAMLDGQDQHAQMPAEHSNSGGFGGRLREFNN